MTISRPQRSVSPPLPGLSRASTPDSNGPSTPRMSSVFPKMTPSKPSVGFVPQLVSSSYRKPEYDELSVMREFASHAEYCDSCRDPGRTYRRGQNLCRTGTELAKDIGKYFYCYDGKPYSMVDKKRRNDRVQVEVPVEYSVVKNLFESLRQGLKLTLPKPAPKIHQSEFRTAAPVRVPTDSYYEVKPARSNSRRHRDTTYAVMDNKPTRTYETRSPNDDRYRDDRDERRPRSIRRGSLYVPDERKERRRSNTFVLPFQIR